VPLNVAVPASGCSRPSSIRRVVVFPAPFGPRKPVTDPGSTVKLRSVTARTDPKCLVTPRTSTRTWWGVSVFPLEMALLLVLPRTPHPIARRLPDGNVHESPACRIRYWGTSMISG
jgi:hypothetical protein